ncbi:MAG TPA: helix-turn-helix domain-containing protein [Solirubrobacteraceae bacterium]|jgi:hypothetical protein|nr:helix-turn-helix domain-containing protein [Solirubrobacteraceae bacterium]
MAPDLLSMIRYEIDERLSELRPLLDEHERLLDAVAALDTAGGALDMSGAPTAAKGGSRRARIGAARRGSAAGAIKLAAAGPATDALEPSAAEQSPDGGSSTRLNGKPRSAARLSRRVADPKPERVSRDIARETILAALEHGSHTVGELAVVTAMSGPSINGNLRKLVSAGAVVKTEREGKAAWALAALA